MCLSDNTGTVDSVFVAADGHLIFMPIPSASLEFFQKFSFKKNAMYVHVRGFKQNEFPMTLTKQANQSSLEIFCMRGQTNIMCIFIIFAAWRATFSPISLSISTPHRRSMTFYASTSSNTVLWTGTKEQVIGLLQSFYCSHVSNGSLPSEPSESRPLSQTPHVCLLTAPEMLISCRGKWALSENCSILPKGLNP